MYTRIITFEDNPGGQQYLFTQSDFYTLQAWVIWMTMNHNHAGVNSAQVSASNVIIHRDAVHTSANRPVGYANSSLLTDLLLADHVSNKDIHSDPNVETSSLATGQLVARGWTEPIYVRAIVSTPLFDVLSSSDKGQLFMPFPMHNMSPFNPYPENDLNTIEPSVDYITNADMAALNGEQKFYGDKMYSQGFYDSFDMPDDVQTMGFYDPELTLSNEEAVRKFGYPYVRDAKDRTNAHRYSEFHQCLYLMPPYLQSKLDLKMDFDALTGASFEENNIAVFFHQPLFVDARRTKILDRINRSGISKEEILNFRDLMGIYMQDVDKPDFFNQSANRTCWLSKYKVVMSVDERANSGLGASLFFSDYEQQCNQFLSQVNYPSEGMANAFGVYYDYPFKVVTIDFNVFPRIGDDDPAKRDTVGLRTFPRCFYDTDFSANYAEAGGHNVDYFIPKEDFYFNTYVTGLMEHKMKYQETIGASIMNFMNYFDRLNVPYGFTNGKRQVLIMKDPDVIRRNLIMKQNPFNMQRLAAYEIVEGYVTVPYEAYSSTYSSSELVGGGGEIKSYETLAAQSPEGWRKDFPAENNATPAPIIPSSSRTGGGSNVGGGVGGGTGTGEDSSDGGGTGDFGDRPGGTGGGGIVNPPPPDTSIDCNNPKTFDEALYCCLKELGIVATGRYYSGTQVFITVSDCGAIQDTDKGSLADCLTSKGFNMEAGQIVFVPCDQEDVPTGTGTGPTGPATGGTGGTEPTGVATSS